MLYCYAVLSGKGAGHALKVRKLEQIVQHVDRKGARRVEGFEAAQRNIFLAESVEAARYFKDITTVVEWVQMMSLHSVYRMASNERRVVDARNLWLSTGTLRILHGTSFAKQSKHVSRCSGSRELEGQGTLEHVHGHSDRISLHVAHDNLRTYANARPPVAFPDSSVLN